MATDFGGKGSRRTFAARLLREVQAQSAVSGTLVPQIAALPAGTLVSTDRLPAVSAGGAGKTLTPANFLAYILPDADKGDITTSASGATWTIDNNVVSYAKLQDASAGNVVLARAAGTSGDYGEVAVGASQLFGRGSTGDVAPITLGTALSMSGTTLNAAGVSDGDKGDITVSASGATWTIDNTAVSYAKIQNVAANTFLANATGSPATVQEIATSRIPLFASAITGTPSGTTYLRGDGAWATVSGSGDVVGPASATDNAVARFDLTTGKLIQNSAVTIADTGATAIAAGSAADALIVTSTGLRQLSVRRAAGTRLDVTVDSSGTATYATTAVNNVDRHFFEGRTSFKSDGDEFASVIVSGEISDTYAQSNVSGVYSVAYSLKTSGNSALVGVYGEAQCFSTGTVDSMIGVEARANANGTLTTLAIGLSVTVSGSATTAYGVKVENVALLGTNYAIYTGTGLVRFGDAVSVVAGSATNALNVTTTGAIQSTFRYDSSNRLDLSVSSAGIVTYDAVGASASHVFSDSVQATEYRVAGTKVVGARGATISDPTGGTVQDSEARTAINTIIDRLQAHGLIA